MERNVAKAVFENYNTKLACHCSLFIN